MVLQNYQKFTEMNSNMIYIVAFGVGLKYPRKIHLNTQWPGGATFVLTALIFQPNVFFTTHFDGF